MSSAATAPMHAPAELPETAVAVVEEPPVLDTYALVYALVLLFLVPGTLSLRGLHFGDDRASTYTFQYVSLVTVPFLLGIVAAFLIDSKDGWKAKLIRIAILTPLVVLTGVTIMFTASLLMLPASQLLGIAGQGLTSAFWIGLVVVALPLPISLYRRLRSPRGIAPVFQWIAIAFALVCVVALGVFSAVQEGSLTQYVRKDVVIYLVGALTWYLPSFGIAAGLWRRSGLV